MRYIVLALLFGAWPASAQIFEDVAPKLGIAGPGADPMSTGIGGGTSWADINGDGKLDLIYTPPQGLPLLFRALSSGFTVDEDALLPDTPPGMATGML